MAENGRGVSSAEGNPGAAGGAGMRGGSLEAVAMVQVNTARAWPGAYGVGGQREGRRFRKRCVDIHSCILRAQVRNYIPELASSPVWFRT